MNNEARKHFTIGLLTGIALAASVVLAAKHDKPITVIMHGFNQKPVIETFGCIDGTNQVCLFSGESPTPVHVTTFQP